MNIEIHVLQNFPSHCLNRDDTGTPKDCEFGQVRRARVSSQCWKRAVRDYFKLKQLVPEDQRAVRTKRVVEAIVKRLPERDPTEAEQRAELLLGAVKLKVKRKEGDDVLKTEYLVFMPERDIDALAALVEEHWDALHVQTATSDEGSEKKKGKKGKKKGAELPKEIVSKVRDVLLEVAKTPELALFGRMIADEPSWNVDAACQVAHAFSTHRVDMDFDFYTAIDDLKPDDTSGSDMMGTIPFNSACFYRYAVVNLDELRSNLGIANAEDETEQLTKALEAFLVGFVRSIPSGKQNSMAAHTPPSYVAFVVREDAPVSLANAFAKPARPNESGDLIAASILKLEKHFQGMKAMYGDDGIRFAAALEAPDLDNGESKQLARVGSLKELITQSVSVALEAR